MTTPLPATLPSDAARRSFLRTSSRFLGLGAGLAAGLSALAAPTLAAPTAAGSGQADARDAGAISRS